MASNAADVDPAAKSMFDKANLTLIQNYKKAGFMLLIFKVSGLHASLFSNKKPKGNVDLENIAVCERNGSFGHVTIHGDETSRYDLYVDAEDLRDVPHWNVKDSYWEIKDDAIHFYLKKL